MKKLTGFILFLLVSYISYAQTGKVFDHRAMESTILGMERKYAVYLPPDYDISERSYPVLYLLHGSGDDQTGWVQFGEVLHITDEAIRKGYATPMIIIMPDARAGRIGFFNSIEGDWQYEDFFFEEFMPFVEKKYRIKGEKRYRAISGLSMGGEAAFIYALHRPELFSSSCPLSASIDLLTLEQFKTFALKPGQKLTDAQIENYFTHHNVIKLLEELDAKTIKSVRWYIDCGDDDFLYEGNSLAHIAMKKRNIPHEFRIRDGGHTWTYWRESLPEVLRFISDAFHQY